VIVVDASVALKWVFVDEELTASANALLEDYVEGRVDLITPNLFPYEIIGGINVAVDRGRITEALGYRAIHYITSLGIELRGFEDLVEPTFRMAREYGLTAYDCAYLALAEKEKCDLVTGDRKLFNSIEEELAWVKWIGDYRAPESTVPSPSKD
jgi:predicted nucleic acid-binding protein